MSLHGNATAHTTPATSSTKGPGTLLWIPYVGLAALCLVFLAVNFWLYHRKHRERYARKAEVLETRERVLERRILLHLLKARHVVTCQDDSSEDDTCTGSTSTLTHINIARNNSTANTAHL